METLMIAQGTSDEDLLARIAEGDRQAMQILFGRHRIRVYRFVLSLVGNTAQAEDLIGDVFLDVWRQAGHFEGRASVTTWLLSIARFKALSGMRKRRDAPLDDRVAEVIPDESDTPDVQLQKKSKSAMLRRCLMTLSDDHREVIDLVYYHERTVDEVAVILGIPGATVKTRMFYARQKLSEILRQAGVDRGWP